MNSDNFRRYIFDRSSDKIAWYHGIDHEDIELPNHQLVILANEVFQSASLAIHTYSEQQISNGLRYLIDPFGGLGDIYMDSSVNEQLRTSAIASMVNVFEGIFVRNCLSKQVHPKAAESDSPYENLCYLWWDIFPRHGIPQRDDMKTIDATILKTTDTILKIENIACQESALHGLSHWQSATPDAVNGIIKSALPKLPPQLHSLAMKAMAGQVQ